MAARQGFISGLFGLRTRSLGSGGSGRWVADFATAEPWGFGTILGEHWDIGIAQKYGRGEWTW